MPESDTGLSFENTPMPLQQLLPRPYLCSFGQAQLLSVQWRVIGRVGYFLKVCAHDHPVVGIVSVLNEEIDYNKTRNYWKYLKAKLKKENNQLGSATTQLKLTAEIEQIVKGWKGEIVSRVFE